MFLKSQLLATSDVDVVNQAMMQGFRVIYLGDSLDPILRDKFVTATTLIPDYQAMAMLVDGNTEGFLRLYTASLNSKPAMEMLSLIFACLYKGIGIILYLPKESEGLNFVQHLLKFIELNYGIITQTRTSQFMFNPQFTDRIIELLYLNNLVTPQEFLINTDKLDEFVIKKLVIDLRPVVADPTNLDDIIKWFSRYKDALLAANKPLINGIQYAGKESDYGCCL